MHRDTYQKGKGAHYEFMSKPNGKHGFAVLAQLEAPFDHPFFNFLCETICTIRFGSFDTSVLSKENWKNRISIRLLARQIQGGQPLAPVVPLNRALPVKQSFSMVATLKDRKCVTCNSETSKLWYNALTLGHAVQYDCQSCYHRRYPYHGPCSKCGTEKSSEWLHVISHDKASPSVCKNCWNAEESRQKASQARRSWIRR